MRHFQHTLISCLSIAAMWGAAALATVAHAQAPAAAFVGTWTVAWQGARTPQQARLVITESGGTYKSTARLDNPCVGKEVPISLENIDGEEATVLLKFSEALQGCPDLKLQIKKLDDKTMRGSFGKTAANLTRV